MRSGFDRRVSTAAASVRERLETRAPGWEVRWRDRPRRVGIILGSGLGGFVDGVEGIEIAYAEIAGYPVPTVEGHRGRLAVGDGVAVAAGRFHAYEGWDMDDVVLPVFLLADLGITHLVVTNAAGAVNESYSPGQLVLIRDHLNLMGRNPLVGPPAPDLGPRFPDMSEAYSARLRRMIRRAWDEALEEGVYAALLGPTYETPSEVRMLRGLGADMAGMSTVPEVIAARSLGLDVLGISCVTNMAAGILETPLDHAEVMETGRRTAERFERLLGVFLSALRRSDRDEG